MIFEDFRGSLGGAPAVHAFIAGVSQYSHFPNGGEAPAKNTFGMPQLTTTASAAWNLYRRLLDRQNHLPRPLGTVRVLLSPSPEEQQKTPGMKAAMPCTRAEFVKHINAWRDDARASSNGFALFYFAGHGVQRSPGDSLILMQDFGDPNDTPMARAVRINDLFWGMAPSESVLDGTALTQMFVVDACRDKPANFPAGEVISVWSDELPAGADNRTAPIFAPVSGTQAYEKVGEEAFFSSRLMKCLEGAGGQALSNPAGGPVKWAVTVHSLSNALAYETDELKRLKGVELLWAPSGWVKNATLHYLDGPPDVNVTLQVDPVEAVPFVRLTVLDSTGKLVMYDGDPVNPHPDSKLLPAGDYRVEASVKDSRYTSVSDITRLMPPQPCTVRVQVAP
jgi:hypothetical protein